MLIVIAKAVNVIMMDFNSVIGLDKWIAIHYSRDQVKYSNDYRIETK
ncbi:hypothetical protein [Tenacibaculum discolor]|uniref:Uncharacterized protein n=1 Tax=Tenacibaculum discolor TaxID=361581 RepID=A0ABT9F637_9FLAO|nr:hypothetical protein [Tenacibaculum discolor]MDP2542065.1 hypothetical protein [Tenacibaculum discolor]